MSLLPKSAEGFASEEYWENFFKKRNQNAFEWYGNYEDLAIHLHKYISFKEHLMIVGCGNSDLSAKLYDAGITKQISIDISTVAVNQMKQKYPHLDFRIADATSMKEFQDKEFSCVLDKGTFDALSGGSEEKETSASKAKALLQEVSRVIKIGGRFLCVSLLQPHVAEALFSFFIQIGWMTRVILCHIEEDHSKNNPCLPVFLTIFTRVNLPGNMKPVIEVQNINSGGFIRLTDTGDLLDFIKDIQKFQYIKKNLQEIGFCAKEGVQLQLADSAGKARYYVNIVDVPKLVKGPLEKQYGVFIIPHGREHDWHFGTHEGRKLLATNVGFARLAVISFARNQQYGSISEVQDEIKGSLGDLAPMVVSKRGVLAPIMTLNNDTGSRTEVCSGTSKFSGDYVVEDVVVEDKVLRRLIFLDSPSLIQSEVELKILRKKGNESKTPLSSNLSCFHHELMVIGFGLLKHLLRPDHFRNNERISCLLIGVGGGLLASFIEKYLRCVNLTAVEIDKEIVKVAREFFGMPTRSKNLNVVVDDGLKYLDQQEILDTFDVILVDVDSKNVKDGLSCPPAAFLSEETFEKYKQAMNKVGSILVINLVCRNEPLKKKNIESIRSNFPFVYKYEIPDEVNCILFCMNVELTQNAKNLKAALLQSVTWASCLNRSDRPHGPEPPSAVISKKKPNSRKNQGNREKEIEDDSLNEINLSNKIELLCNNFTAVGIT